MAAREVKTLQEALADLVGRPCFSAICGSGVEFAFVLHLGEKLIRSLRLANPRLSFLKRTYEGSHTLLVECTWRIEGPDGVVATCLDAAKPEGPRDAALAELEDRTVEAVRVVEPAFDLVVSFEDGWTLRCFPTEVDEKARRVNWTYAWPGGMATVGPRSRLTIDTAADQEARAAKKRPASVEEEIVERWKRLKDERSEEDQ